MPPYGKNMRSCCDSVAQRGSRHIRGCTNYTNPTSRVEQKVFIQMDNSTDVIMMSDGSFSEWLDTKGYKISEGSASHALMAAVTITQFGSRRGIAIMVDYDREEEIG